ncbi:MAG: hypothetical protein IKH19_01520 [Muribaculaceae bacterium]|nr:hypothetical protein [Muribaculaceae bacterium]
MKHLVYLITGIVLTIVFFVLASSSGFNIYERLYYSQGFNDALYNHNMYPTMALITIAITWGAAAIYYYVINSVKFDRWYHWLAVAAIVTLLVPIVCYAYNDAVFARNGLGYIAESIVFQLQNLLWTPLLFIIASFAMRWWSSNCRHTPIPQ